MYQNFVGIDIGKDHFYGATHGLTDVKEYPNNDIGFHEFYTAHKNTLPETLIVLETTGGYEMALIDFLLEHQCLVHRANTSKVKHFIRSYGKLGKSDKIDARGLAHYAAERHRSLHLFVKNKRKKLLKLVERRSDLKQILVQEKNRYKAPDQADLADSFQRIIKSIEEEIVRVEQQINDLCGQNDSLHKQKEVLKTIPGIGDITAIQLLALLPEMGHIDRRKIASLAGVAPHPNESGRMVGHRYTRGGRSQVKPVLFMAAMSAARSHSELAGFYQRLVGSGKKKIVALTALMRKIITIANARMRDFYAEMASTQHS